MALYELNKVFHPVKGKRPAETYQIAAVATGLIQEPSWTAHERPSDYYDAKGLAESLVKLARFKESKWEYGVLTMPYQNSESFRACDGSGNTLIWGGMLSPRALKNFGLTGPVAAVEANLTLMGQEPTESSHYRPLPRFPEAWRDIALVVPDGVTSAQVLEGVKA